MRLNCKVNLTRREKLGIALEKWIYAILKVLFLATEGYRITPPDWDNYNNHNGVDFKVFWYDKLILAVECKNWRQRTFKYGSDVAQTEVIERFRYIGTSLKILLISFADLFYKPALNLIKQNGITLIETQKLIGHKDYRSQLFYTIKSAISELTKQHQKPQVSSTLSNTNTNTITNYCSCSRANNSNNYIPNNRELSDKEILEELSKPVKPSIEVNHPCQVEHRDHERWLSRMLERAERLGNGS